MSNALFFHAGCPVCLSAEQQFVNTLDPTHYAVEVIHLANKRPVLQKPSRQASIRCQRSSSMANPFTSTLARHWPI